MLVQTAPLSYSELLGVLRQASHLGASSPVRASVVWRRTGAARKVLARGEGGLCDQGNQGDQGDQGSQGDQEG